MTREELTTLITAKYPDIKAGTMKKYPEFIVPTDKIHQLCRELKDLPETRMDYLFGETAADRKDGFHMVYFLTSSTLGHCIMLRVVLTDKANPSVDTVSDIWRAAEYHEREVFDLFGIRFNNHPDLRRIFLEDDWVGHPLRKDYKDSFTLVK
ncbi:MAG: NADH-quinone oxidoreductase subunit C [Bacteroidetes bacterium]|nr:NADH-quinone oxidoreductase subunit C [Bacteroidota bacterium]